MTPLTELLNRQQFEHHDLVRLLEATTANDAQLIRRRACAVLEQECGTAVYYRGLIEFSNQCCNDCHYCGIRAGNSAVQRYRLSLDEIAQGARWCARQGYGSLVLQSGERRDEPFVSFVEQAIARIKAETVGERLPRGLGITLCVGEQSPRAYERFFDAGAHRYLLRIETTSPRLFARLHPAPQTLARRIECLQVLKRIGYQVGTGVMIGLPGQSTNDLACDIAFFRDMDVDMIGMGPYIEHSQAVLAQTGEALLSPRERFALALRMIAVCRIVLRNVNIAATTALQALVDDGREQGLLHGANVIMPQLTPTPVRPSYQLYEGKPCLDESAVQCRGCLKRRIESTGRVIATDEWGDSPHALGRTGSRQD